MEEVPETKLKTRARPVGPSLVPSNQYGMGAGAQDYSSLGVPVDPYGNIVPLIDKQSGPVRPFFSQTEVYWTPPVVYQPVYSQPYWPYLPNNNPYFPYRPYLSPAPVNYLSVPVYPNYSGPFSPYSSAGLNFNFGRAGSANGGYLWLPGTRTFQYESSVRPFAPTWLH